MLQIPPSILLIFLCEYLAVTVLLSPNVLHQRGHDVARGGKAGGTGVHNGLATTILRAPASLLS